MKQKILIAVLLILGFVLRFYSLNDFPNGLQRDEAFLGYNAYSILKTGREISGDFLPLHLRSFLFTPAGYSYFSAPSVFLFGLSTFSIRFASALFGFLTIPLTYFLARNLLEREKVKQVLNLPLFAAFLLTISPWHINLSRTGSAITPVVFFILLGVYLFLRAEKSKTLLLFSFISFFVSLFFYVSPYSFLPIFIPVLFFFFKTKFNKLFIVLYVLFIISPLFITLASDNLSIRVNSISILRHDEARLRLEESARNDGAINIKPEVVRFFHNKPSVISTIFLENYFNHLSYSFLFSENNFPERYRIPRVGILYLFELVLLAAGIIFVIKNNYKLGYFLLTWILISPIGSSLAFDDVPNMQRTLYMLPPLVIIEAIGFGFLLTKFNSKIISSVIIVIISLNAVYYLHQYYYHGASYRLWYRQDGYEKLVEKLDKHLPNYDKVIVTNRESGASIEVAFFEKYDPLSFQKETATQDIKKSETISYGKFQFVDDECPLRIEASKNGTPVVVGEKGTLYVNSGLCKELDTFKLLEAIRRADNSVVFYILSL